MLPNETVLYYLIPQRSHQDMRYIDCHHFESIDRTKVAITGFTVSLALGTSFQVGKSARSILKLDNDEISENEIKYAHAQLNSCIMAKCRMVLHYNAGSWRLTFGFLLQG